MSNIGFIGLGIMGKPMAANLIKGGHKLFLSSRTSVPAELTAAGGTACANAKEVAQKSDIVIVMVPDTPDVEKVLFGTNGVAEGLSKGKIVVDMSSISPIETKSYAKRINGLGCEYLDAPVSGGDQDAAAHLYVWALKDIPQDLRDALAAAAVRETSVPGQRVLNTNLKNVQVADSEDNLVCQDTGIAVYTCHVREHFPLHPARIYEALKAGTARATIEHPLRSNAVHTITRENTGPNIGHRLPIVHWEFVQDWDGMDVKCVPKGSGSENMSFLKMCVPADGVKGIKQFVLESIVGAGGKPCPPGIVGVGIGGSADYAMYLAKEAITRPIGTRNADPLVAQLEDELMGLLNETGIGPMGLGGDVTLLNCHIEHADTHMTLNPVAVNYQCWAARRATAHIAADGTTDFDREA